MPVNPSSPVYFRFDHGVRRSLYGVLIAATAVNPKERFGGCVHPNQSYSRFAIRYTLPVTVDEVRTVSSAVFGHRYRLELLAALASAGDDGVCVTTLAADRDVASSVFYPPLRSLMQAGLVRRTGPVGAGRRVFYAITESALWEGLRQMVQDLGVDITGSGGAGAVTP
jgi:hypothetical protein